MDRKESSIPESTQAESEACFLLNSAVAGIKPIHATNEYQTPKPRSTDGLWTSWQADKLQWLPEVGIGWFPVTANPYDEAYWKRYREMDATPIGIKLTGMRVDLVRQHTKGQVVDIGIGGGRFVAALPGQAKGYDINPAAVEWLKGAGRWFDPYAEVCESATFWDSLEHIHDPSALLANVRRYAFVSVPIFKDCADILRSKHYRKTEHCWYFTVSGMQRFMGRFGFEQIERNGMEQRAGRQAIETFVFRRVGVVQ
jgi:hypothetical protein